MSALAVAALLGCGTIAASDSASDASAPETDASTPGSTDAATDAAIETTCESSILLNDNDGNILVIKPDGSEHLVLTGVVDAPGTLQWSPDGTKFFWHRFRPTRRAVWVVDADGSNTVDVNGPTDVPKSIAWLQDSDGLVLTLADPSGATSVVRMNSDGSNRTTVATAGPENRILSADATNTHAFYVLADGSAWRRPLDGSAASEPLTINLGPDGRFLKYSPQADRLIVRASAGLATMSSDGTSLIELQPSTGDSHFGTGWLGADHVFATQYEIESREFSAHVYAVADGSEVSNLLPGGEVFQTDIQATDPSGQSILYNRLSGEPEIWIVDRDGTNDRFFRAGIRPKWQPCVSSTAR